MPSILAATTTRKPAGPAAGKGGSGGAASTSTPQQRPSIAAAKEALTPPSFPVPEVLAPAGGRGGWVHHEISIDPESTLSPSAHGSPEHFVSRASTPTQSHPAQHQTGQFLAALNSGADAVFLGLQAFNARARAENFGIEDLRELVPLAHRYGMKVRLCVCGVVDRLISFGDEIRGSDDVNPTSHTQNDPNQVLVTVNVLIKEGELRDLVEVLSALEELEVDAAIVQDQAVGSLAKRFFPRLRLHASTQMAVHNLQGVERAAALGYRRVVLARELTAKEMGDIRAAVKPEVAELEAFCHGSLCYS